MAKRKKTVKETPPALKDWPEGGSQIGTPTMVMFPARNFHFKVLKDEHKITIPRKGKYNDLAPEIFGKDEGEFMVYDEESTVMYLPAITKILFAVQKYPDLESNQLFAPIALLINDDTVDIIGQVVEMLPPEPVKSTIK